MQQGDELNLIDASEIPTPEGKTLDTIINPASTATVVTRVPVDTAEPSTSIMTTAERSLEPPTEPTSTIGRTTVSKVQPTDLSSLFALTVTKTPAEPSWVLTDAPTVSSMITTENTTFSLGASFTVKSKEPAQTEQEQTGPEDQMTTEEGPTGAWLLPGKETATRSSSWPESHLTSEGTFMGSDFKETSSTDATDVVILHVSDAEDLKLDDMETTTRKDVTLNPDVEEYTLQLEPTAAWQTVSENTVMHDSSSNLDVTSVSEDPESSMPTSRHVLKVATEVITDLHELTTEPAVKAPGSEIRVIPDVLGAARTMETTAVHLHEGFSMKKSNNVNIVSVVLM